MSKLRKILWLYYFLEQTTVFKRVKTAESKNKPPQIKPGLTAKEWSLIFFLVGLVLFYWPFLGALQEEVCGMFYYLFFVWGGIIILLFFTAPARKAPDKKQNSRDNEKEKG